MSTGIAGGDPATAAEGRLKLLLKEVLEEEREVLPMEADGWIRVSRISGICSREEVLCATEGLIRADEVGADLGAIFAHGHALHSAMQNLILGPAGVLYGAWRCTMCGEAWGELECRDTLLVDHFDEYLSVRPIRCTNCDEAKFEYEELHLFDTATKICGHPDGFLKLPGVSTPGVFELKTISPRGAWEVRGCPKLDHVIQLQVYMHLTGLRWGKILYWDKGGSGISSFVEHTVEYDPDVADSVLTMIDEIRVGIRKRKLPARICADIGCPRAEECPVAEACFAREDAST